MDESCNQFGTKTGERVCVQLRHPDTWPAHAQYQATITHLVRGKTERVQVGAGFWEWDHDYGVPYRPATNPSDVIIALQEEIGEKCIVSVEWKIFCAENHRGVDKWQDCPHCRARGWSHAQAYLI